MISVSNDNVSVKSVEDEWLIAALPLPQVGMGNILIRVCLFVNWITQKVIDKFSSNLENRIMDQKRLNFGTLGLWLAHMVLPVVTL